MVKDDGKIGEVDSKVQEDNKAEASAQQASSSVNQSEDT